MNIRDGYLFGLWVFADFQMAWDNNFGRSGNNLAGQATPGDKETG
jgi:hypothetical protein